MTSDQNNSETRRGRRGVIFTGAERRIVYSLLRQPLINARGENLKIPESSKTGRSRCWNGAFIIHYKIPSKKKDKKRRELFLESTEICRASISSRSENIFIFVERFPRRWSLNIYQWYFIIFSKKHLINKHMCVPGPIFNWTYLRGRDSLEFSKNPHSESSFLSLAISRKSLLFLLRVHWYRDYQWRSTRLRNSVTLSRDPTRTTPLAYSTLCTHTHTYTYIRTAVQVSNV